MILQEYEYYLFPNNCIYQSSQYLNIGNINSTQYIVRVKGKGRREIYISMRKSDVIKHITKEENPEYFL